MPINVISYVTNNYGIQAKGLKMRIKTVLTKVVLLTFVMYLGGCYSANPEDMLAFTKPSNNLVAADNYILQPPDDIQVHCSAVPELNRERQKIRPDGKVTFESLGEVQAAGKTPKELAETLREQIVSLYALSGDNPIDVRITAFKSKVYYVLGQVYKPGPKTFTGHDTVFRAIAQARINPMAWEQRVQVIRPSADKTTKPKIFEIDYDRMMAHGDLGKDVLLEEGDIVYVPPTILSGIAMVIEEFARPIGRAFSTVNVVYRGQAAPDRY